MRDWIMNVVRPSWGMLWHAAAGLGIGIIVAAAHSIGWAIGAYLLVTFFGFAREYMQAGSWSNFNTHKFVEGLCWSACWLGLLAV